MKKLLSLIVLAAVCVAFNANAVTLAEKVAKVNTSYEKRIEKIENMRRASPERKNVLKKHAREDADLKIAHLKDLDKLTVANTKK